MRVSMCRVIWGIVGRVGMFVRDSVMRGLVRGWLLLKRRRRGGGLGARDRCCNDMGSRRYIDMFRDIAS